MSKYRDLLFNIFSNHLKYQFKSFEKYDDNKIIIKFLDGTTKKLEVY